MDEPLDINQRKKCPALDFSDDKESNNSDSITRLTKIHEDSGEENIESERLLAKIPKCQEVEKIVNKFHLFPGCCPTDSEKVRQVPYTSEF